MSEKVENNKTSNETFDIEEICSALKNDSIHLTTDQIQRLNVNDKKTLYHIGKLYYKQHNYPKAFSWYSKSAALDYWPAQKEIAWMYRAGLGISVDRNQAMTWFIKAIDLNENKYAQNNIGYMYLYGEHVKKDALMAMVWYKKSANQGCVDAQYGLASIYHHTLKDLQNAVEWYQRAADNGSLVSFMNLKRLHDQGYYPNKTKEEEEVSGELGQQPTSDENQSALDKLKWMAEKSQFQRLVSELKYDGIKLSPKETQKAIHNDGKTLCNIGTQYYSKKDYYQALTWYRKASEQGYWPAHNEIGWMYLSGLGLPIANASQAMVHFIKAATISDNQHAVRSIGTIYLHGSYGMSKDIPSAIEWFTKAAHLGSENAQYHLGYIYESYAEVKDVQVAVNWYTMAAKHGSIIPFCVVRRLNRFGYYADTGEDVGEEDVKDQDINQYPNNVSEKKMKEWEDTLKSNLKKSEDDANNDFNYDTEDDMEEDPNYDLNYDSEDDHGEKKRTKK